VNPKNLGYFLFASVLFLAAGVAFWFAWVVYSFACEGENTTTERCTASAPQFLAAGCGLLPAVLTLVATARARHDRARHWIVLTIVAYAAWAVLLFLPYA